VLTDTIRLRVDTIFYSLLHAKDRVLVRVRKRVERMSEYVVIINNFLLMLSIAWVKARTTPLDTTRLSTIFYRLLLN
jgi:hypothetical protein